MKIRKLALLADGANPHTIKWIRSLAARQIEIILLSLNHFDPKLYSVLPNVRAYSFAVNKSVTSSGSGSVSKLKYLSNIFAIRKILKEFKPQILHAHFASSYGLVGALCFFPKFFISVWGSDVYLFPRRGFIHRATLKFILSRATKIFSTSHAMAQETSRYTCKKIEIIPFGVDVSRFTPSGSRIHLFSDDCLVIGTIKSLEKIYGLYFLIEAFALLSDKYPHMKLKLLLVGRGSQEEELKTLVDKLKIKEHVLFTGWIDVDSIPAYHRTLDIAVFPSLSESFGVAAVEASASGRAVVASNVGGLPEVVEQGITGFIVESQKVDSLFSSIEKLILDPELRKNFGRKGREKVILQYDWQANVQQMISEYSKIL